MSNIGHGWIGVDLDGTLAHYEGWKGADVIGAPIPAMVERVKRWLGEGRVVKIFTARVSHFGNPESIKAAAISREAIKRWCMKHIGCELPITHAKDYGMIELWDDRAVQVIPNTGEPVERGRS